MTDPLQDFRTAILNMLGSAPESIEAGRMQRFPTSARRGDTAGWSKLFADLRGGVFGDHRRGIAKTWCATDRTGLTRWHRAALAAQVLKASAEREADQRRQWAANAQRIVKLHRECVPLVHGDPVTLYLKRRGFGGVWPLPACLWLHRALPYWHDGAHVGTYPAMVAPLIAPDGRTVALHRTYLMPDGRKADLPAVKKLTAAAGPLAGACIPLFAPELGRIAIAEGIETALAAWCASGVPTVAAYSAGNMAVWRWPVGVRRLMIFADHDTAGAEAADRLRQRARLGGVSVQVLTPSAPGTDWCDVWAQRATEVAA